MICISYPTKHVEAAVQFYKRNYITSCDRICS